MPSVRIWTLESDYDARAVRSLAEKLAIHFQLDRLSIQTSGKGALPKPNRIGNSPHEMLRKAVRNYLKQDDCVIFVIDSDGPMSSHQRRQEPNSLINQIMQIVRDSSFVGRVSFCPGSPRTGIVASDRLSGNFLLFRQQTSPLQRKLPPKAHVCPPFLTSGQETSAR